MEQSEFEAKGEAILAILRPLSPLQREDVMAVVTAVFCPHCWGPQPEGIRSCQCWNDE